MKRPILPSLILVSGAAVIGLTRPLQAAEPAPTAPTAGNWLNRVAATPKKLAFWRKDGPAAAEATPELTAAQPTPAKNHRSGTPAPPSRPPSTAKKSAATPAPATASPPPPPAEPRPRLFARLPKLFVKDAPPAEATRPVPAVAAVVPGKRESASSTAPKTAATTPAKSKKAKPDAPAVVVAPAEPKKPWSIARLWPGAPDDKAVAPAKNEKLGPAKPGATPAAKVANQSPSKPASTPAPTPTPEKKPSLWSRLASTVVPASSKSETPAKPAVVRAGLPPAAIEPGTSTYVVTKDDSAFYTFGPHQATAPDAYLPTGTVVTLKEKSWGWAQVTLADGRSGTMARDAIRLATHVDLIPTASERSMMAAVSPARVKSPSFVLPPADMPDLPTSAADAASADTEALSAALLPPFAE